MWPRFLIQSEQQSVSNTSVGNNDQVSSSSNVGQESAHPMKRTAQEAVGTEKDGRKRSKSDAMPAKHDTLPTDTQSALTTTELKKAIAHLSQKQDSVHFCDVIKYLCNEKHMKKKSVKKFLMRKVILSMDFSQDRLDLK